MGKRAMMGLAMMLALGTFVLAGERPSMAKGTVVSATLDGDMVKWQLDLGADAGKKTYEMTADVQVAYTEKDGAKLAMNIRGAKGREMKAREGVTVAKGKFASAKIADDGVVVTITPTEGEKALEVKLPKEVSIYYREGEGGKLMAMGIGVPRAPKAEGK